MKASRTARFLVTWLALVSLAFSQLAVAAYACPGSDAMVQAAVAMAEEMPDCHNRPEAVDALCQAHCQQGDSVDRVAGPAVAAVIPTGFVVVRVAATVPRSAPSQVPPSLLERPTEPPRAVRHCRLHI